jgi:chromatin segregation and condensation protein Rec8/ScpA/Scc1 (kleisin family)
MPQAYDPRTAHDFASLSDMVAPYAGYNGGDSDATVGWSSPGDGTVEGPAAGRGKGDERKTRRLASNRESAKRSRVRKQRRLDELSSRAARLHATNQRLLVELNRVIAEHGRVARESAQLQEEASELRRKLDVMGVDEAELDAAQSTEERPEI